MEIHLIRHAHAGSRKGWDGDDRERPLSDRGWTQAQGIEKALGDVGIDRLWSSSYIRCLQTLDPLADRLGLEVEVIAPLTEGGSGAEALDLLLEDARPPVGHQHALGPEAGLRERPVRDHGQLAG